MHLIHDNIYIGKSIINNIELYTKLISSPKLLIVTDNIVADLYLEQLQSSLVAFDCAHLILSAGEQHKTWSAVELILEQLKHLKFDRSSTIISLGGGVIGDLTGFAAALYMRGINWIQIPTTLLAQVDASIGGKTGCNHLGIKNLLGTFYTPKYVLVDISMLQTLSEREYTAGLAEVVKYGIACDAEFFHWLEAHKQAVKARKEDKLIEMIAKCIAIKLAIVEQDRLDQNKRMVLNFGHTFGHALEAATEFQYYLHGEAVAIGMLLAARLAVKLELLDQHVLDRLTDLLVYLGLPINWNQDVCSAQKLCSYMKFDKKQRADKLNLILLCAIGKTLILDSLDFNQLVVLEEAEVY
jgi:3-dehydroquinate synthase